MTVIRCNLNLHFMFKYGRLVFFFNEAFVNRKLSISFLEYTGRYAKYDKIGNCVLFSLPFS